VPNADQYLVRPFDSVLDPEGSVISAPPADHSATDHQMQL